MAQTTIQGSFLGDATVTGAKIGADFISAQTALATGLATTDEIIVSDAGVIKRMDISVLEIAATQITASGTLPALNGAALTALTAANITASGTLPALNGAALTALNGTQITSGTLPAARIAADSIVEGKLNVSNGPTNGHVLTARDGVAGGFTWEAASGTTINSNADNRVITGSGTANTLNGETGLVFTGTLLGINTATPDSGQYLHIVGANGSITENSGVSATTTSQLTVENNSNAAISILSPAADFGAVYFGDSNSNIAGGLIYNHGRPGLDVRVEGATKYIFEPSLMTVPGGIKFPATVSLSSNANTLDDYQEGTFTPTLHDWSFDSTEATYLANRVGRYVKIGRFVYFWLNVGWSSIGTLATGSQGLVGGLPFTAMAGTNHNASCTVSFAWGLGLNNAGENPTATINANTAYLSFHMWSHTYGAQSMNFGNWGPNPDANFQISGFYETEA